METNAIQSGQAAGQQAASSEEIVFDTASGISLEEQQEILAGINAMTVGNRLAGGAPEIKAKKKGFLFPLCVNIGALALLALGFALLLFYHGNDEQEIRESSAAVGLTERKLIQEIRRETYRQISEKEDQINDIMSKLSAADEEYRTLQGSVETLTEANQERASYLLSMQEEYRLTLSGLQEEKTGILEDSRLREAELRSHAEERVKELSHEVAQSQASLGAAVEELNRLSTEQERISMVEQQMGGYYLTENNLIAAGRLDEASATLEIMKAFLDTPSLQGIRSLKAKKQTHLAAIAALEGAVAEARRLRIEPAPAPVETQAQDETIAALKTMNEALEQKAADQERTIAAFSSQGSEQTSMIAGFETRINGLRTENDRLSTAVTNQQQTLNRRDSEMQSLRTDMAQKDSAIENLRNESAGKDRQLTELNNRINTLDNQIKAQASSNEAALAQQKSENTILQAERDDLQRQYGNLQRQYEELQRRMDAAVRAFTGE